MSVLRPALIVLDLDGTLVDSAPDIAYSTSLMLYELGMPAPTLETISGWIGNGVGMLIKRALTDQQNPDFEPENFKQALGLFSDIYLTNVFNKSTLYPGVLEGLENFQAKRMKLACVTNKTERFTMPLLKQAGLDKFLDFVGCGDHFEKLKPDPMSLLKTAETFDVQPDQAIIVGDSINDMEAGRAAGYITVSVPYGYLGDYSVEDLRADHRVNTLIDLVELCDC